VEGIGEDFWPTTYDPSVIDTVIPISDADSFAMARRVAVAEGILIGGSGGTAVAAMLTAAETAAPGSLLVALIPDSGRGYLSRVFDDEWMAAYGFTRTDDGPTVGDAIAAKPARGSSGNTPSLVWVNPDQSVRETVDAMRHDAVSQVLVIKNQPPFAAAEVVGAVTELELMDATFHDPAVLDAHVGDVMGPKLPMVGIGQALSDAVAALDKGPAVLVLADGRPYTVLTRTDILTYLRKEQR
jgi:cystathionine beta-synthase